MWLCGCVVRSKGDTWWWSEEVMEAISRKKDVPNVMCRNNAGENRNRYKSVRNKAMETVSKATREKVDEVHTDFRIIQME